MDWYSVGVAAVCGALAGGAGTLAARQIEKETTRRIVTALVSALLFVSLFGWAKNTVIKEHKAQVALSEFDSLIAGNPALESLQEFAPDAMEKLRNHLLTAARDGAAPAVIETQGRQIVAEVVSQRLPRASDDALLNSIRLTLDQMKHLHARGDNSCFRFLFPNVDGGIQAQQVFSAALIARDQESTRMLLSTYDASRAIPTEAEAMEFLRPIYAGLFESHGEEALNALSNAATQDVDRSLVCELSIDIYARVMALDEQDAVTTLRWMLQ